VIQWLDGAAGMAEWLNVLRWIYMMTRDM